MQDTDVTLLIGQLQGTQDATEKRLDTIESKIDTLVSYMDTAKGGIGTLYKVGAAGATVSAIVVEGLHYLTGKHS
jgi:hypothetical protein